MPFPQHPQAAWGVAETGGAALALDPRPLFRVGDLHLGHALRQLLVFALGQARDNPYRFEASAADRCDIALIDMTERGGAEVAEVLSEASGVRPVVRVGRRNDSIRGQDDLLYNEFTDKLLATLNRVVDEHLLRRSNVRIVAEPGQVQIPDADNGRGDHRVLVVDDSPTLRRQLAVALHRLGLESEGAVSGAQALKVLLTTRFDLVFVDVMMPDMDGYQLTRAIKRAPLLKHLPVVILTSRTSPFDLARGALAGCDSYLVKPLSPQALRGTLSRLLVLPDA